MVPEGQVRGQNTSEAQGAPEWLLLRFLSLRNMISLY